MDFAPEYMEKIVKNLISNAMKFTPVDGSIQVKTSMDGKGNLMLVVSDTGTGIDPTHLSHLFELFFQTEGPNRKLGSGLGLPIVEQLVTGMGGKINVESQLEKGSTFTVVIPLKHGTQQYKSLSEWPCNSMTENIQSDTQKIQSDDAGYSTNILIVEDNIDVANYIVHLLDNQYGVMLATNGESALEKASATIPSLIITDVMMPGMDGFEFCRQIRENSLLSHIPVIILTAKVEDIDRIHSFEVGADAYVPKPFKAAELLTRVQNLLLQRQQLQEKYTRAVMDEESSKVAISQSDRKLMDHLTDIIYSPMKEGEVDVEHIAEKMQMSTSQFRRKVEAVTGEPPIQHINRIRMIYAKQFYHQSPTEYRKSLLRKI